MQECFLRLRRSRGDRLGDPTANSLQPLRVILGPPVSRISYSISTLLERNGRRRLSFPPARTTAGLPSRCCHAFPPPKNDRRRSARTLYGGPAKKDNLGRSQAARVVRRIVIERTRDPITQLGMQIPSLTYPDVPTEGLFERIAEMARTCGGRVRLGVGDGPPVPNPQGRDAHRADAYTLLGGIAARTATAPSGHDVAFAEQQDFENLSANESSAQPGRSHPVYE
jgi:hypothetical protein